MLTMHFATEDSARRTRVALLLALLLGWLGDPSPSQSADLPCDGLFPLVAFSGQPETYTIPTDAPPAAITLQVKGGDGGSAAVERCRTSGCRTCRTNGGKGAEVFARFAVGNGPDELRPGGTLRFVIGERGTDDSATTFVSIAAEAGGGGGGSAVLYRPPGITNDTCGIGGWEVLVAAGGGGGAYQGAAPVAGCVDSRNGQAGQLGESGGDGNPGRSGGSNGNGGSCGAAGASTRAGGGGGAFTSGDSACNNSGGGGCVSGGNPGTRGASGGWGFGAGGGGGIGGGGGGGYSGGGGGSQSGRGGGGGSYVASYALSSSLEVSEHPSRDGYVQYQCDCGVVAPSNDECSTAAPLLSGTNAGCTEAATDSTTDYSCSDGGIVNDVWYTYTNDKGCPVRLELNWCDNDFLDRAAFYWGCGESEAACSGGASCQAGATIQPGDTLKMRLGGAPGAITPPDGRYEIDVSIEEVGQDTDGDGTADGCDACPLDPIDDSDQDGICNSDDPCPASTDDLCTPATGFSCPYTLDRWLDVNIPGGFAFITPNSGAADSARFSYGVNVPGGVSNRAAIFETTVETGGIWTFDYTYSGDHSSDGARARFTVAVVGPNGQTNYQVVSQPTDGDFEFSGTVSVPVNAGFAVGLIVGGENTDDSGLMSGALELSNVTWPAVNDADLDGVPDTCDACADGDDALDSDGDGVADACDICPLDNPDDPDGDGVCFSNDLCPGSDDTVDGDGDGVPDGCDLCPDFDDFADQDGDDAPDGCDLCPGFDDDLDIDADGIPDGCDAEPLAFSPCTTEVLGRRGNVPIDLDVPAMDDAQINITLFGGGGGDAEISATGCRTEGGAGTELRLAYKIGLDFAPGGTLRFILGEKGRAARGLGDHAAAGGGGGSALMYLPPGGDWAQDGVLLAVAGAGGGAVSQRATSGGCASRPGLAAVEQICGGDGEGAPDDPNAGLGGCDGAGGEPGFIDMDLQDLELASGGGASAYQDGGGGIHGGSAGWPSGGDGGEGAGSHGGWGFGGGGAGHFGGGGGGGGYMGGGGSSNGGGGGGRNYVNNDYGVAYYVDPASEATDGYAEYYFFVRSNDNPNDGTPLIVNGNGDVILGSSAEVVAPDQEVWGTTCSATDSNARIGAIQYSRALDVPTGPYNDVWYVIGNQGSGAENYTLSIWTPDPAHGSADDLSVSFFALNGDLQTGRRGTGVVDFGVGSTLPTLIRVTSKAGPFRFLITRGRSGPTGQCANAPTVGPDFARYSPRSSRDDDLSSCGVLDVNGTWFNYTAECSGQLEVEVTGVGWTPVLSAYRSCGSPDFACTEANDNDNRASLSLAVQRDETLSFRLGASPVHGIGNAISAFDMQIDLVGPDGDGDGVLDACDNCPSVANAPQADSDSDGIGDACDDCPGGNPNADADGDGVCDAIDVCANGDDGADADGDGQPDACDICPNTRPNDADGDGNCGSPIVITGTLVSGSQESDALNDPTFDTSCAPFHVAAMFDFWTVEATAGDNIQIEVEREDSRFNPYLSLWQGDLNGATLEDFTAADFNASQTLLATANDEAAPATSTGPGGDPVLRFLAPATGTYTVLVAGDCDSAGGSYPYTIRAGFNLQAIITNITQGTLHPTIQDALDNAVTGDVIEIGAGTVSEDGIQFPDGLDVTLRGAGRDQTVIDGGAVSGQGDRLAILNMLDSGQTAATVIADLSLVNGYHNRHFGGGATLRDVSATFRNVGFFDNEVRSSVGSSDFVVIDERGDPNASFVCDGCYFGAPTSGASGTLIYSTGRVHIINSIMEAAAPPEPGEAAIYSLFGGAPLFEITNTTVGGRISIESYGDDEGITSPLRVTNSVVRFLEEPGSGFTHYRYSLARNAPTTNADGSPTFSSNVNPVFVNPDDGDYRLASNTPGVDAADYDAYLAAGGGALDGTGNQRTVDDAATTDTGVGTMTYLDMGGAEWFPDDDNDGVPDQNDLCPDFNDRQDTDGDGIPDRCDACTPSAADADGDGVCDLLDVCADADDNADGDADGVPDGCDICLAGDDSIDTDSDGTPDACDACPTDPLLTDAPMWHPDTDNDGYGDPNQGVASCVQPSNAVANADDCDDSEPNSFPGAVELCDGQDNDCDTLVDEGAGTLFYADTDSDGFGNPLNFTRACSAPPGFVGNASDCDDDSDAIAPGRSEICDGIDQNCNGVLDDGLPDFDSDGLCNDRDSDDDNDGVNDGEDIAPLDPNRCRDLDIDTCDDCTNTGADNSGGDPSNDGPDADLNGICDAGELTPTASPTSTIPPDTPTATPTATATSTPTATPPPDTPTSTATATATSTSPSDTPTATATASPTSTAEPSTPPPTHMPGTSTPTATAGATATPDAALAPNAIVGYYLRAPNRNAGAQRLPQAWVVNIDDQAIDGADDPENFLIGSHQHIFLPASTDGSHPPTATESSYLRYAMKRGRESVAPASSTGRFPRPERHLKRDWQLENVLGDIEVRSYAQSSLLLPAGVNSTAPDATAPVGAPHYACYSVRTVRGVVSAQTSGKLFATDLQIYVRDLLDECALDTSGTASFAGTAVESSCLIDVRRPVELCNPIAMSEVEPPRSTSAVITPSGPDTGPSLLCYRARLASRFRSADAAATAGTETRDRIDPKQSAHQPRTVGDANPLHTAPASMFPAPTVVETRARDRRVCLVTDVLSVTPSP